MKMQLRYRVLTIALGIVVALLTLYTLATRTDLSNIDSTPGTGKAGLIIRHLVEVPAMFDRIK